MATKKVTSAATDEELVLDGGEQAMAELVSRYEGPLYRFLLSMVGQAQLAEDLFQETFLRFHRYRSSYAPHCQLRPYLYRIAVNVAREAYSRKSVKAKLLSLNGESNGALLREQLEGSSPDPQTATEDNEMRTGVRSAIQELPDIEREVVQLRVYEEMTFPQISIATGVSVSTAQSRMVYAIRRLRRILKARVQATGAGPGILGRPEEEGGGQ